MPVCACVMDAIHETEMGVADAVDAVVGYGYGSAWASTGAWPGHCRCRSACRINCTRDGKDGYNSAVLKVAMYGDPAKMDFWEPVVVILLSRQQGNWERHTG